MSPSATLVWGLKSAPDRLCYHQNPYHSYSPSHSDTNHLHQRYPPNDTSDFAKDDSSACIPTSPPLPSLYHANTSAWFLFLGVPSEPSPSHRSRLASVSSLAAAAKDRGPKPSFCSRGRRVAREAQMQARETSMKLQMLRGTIVSVACQSGAKDRRLGREVVNLHVKSSEMEKSRMYLKRTRVAMQALLCPCICQQSVVPIQLETALLVQELHLRR